MITGYKSQDIYEWSKTNIDKLMSHSTIQSIVVEMMVAEKNNWRYVDGNGYDHLDENNLRIETKVTSSVQQGRYLRVGNIESKKNKCDVIQIIDRRSNREFRIPHDVFFKRACLSRGQFWWSADYIHWKLTEISHNTTLLLEYEVK